MYVYEYIYIYIYIYIYTYICIIYSYVVISDPHHTEFSNLGQATWA